MTYGPSNHAAMFGLIFIAATSVAQSAPELSQWQKMGVRLPSKPLTVKERLELACDQAEMLMDDLKARSGGDQPPLSGPDPMLV
jgi:hypothetical protein